MATVHCHVPIRIRLVGRPTVSQLDAMGDRLAALVQARLADADRVVGSTGAPVDVAPAAGASSAAAPREPRDPSRYDPAAAAYAVPSYDDDGDPEAVPVDDAAEDLSVDAILELLPEHPSYADLHRDFALARSDMRTDDAVQAARDMIWQLDLDVVREDAWEVAAFLYANGHEDLAQRYVERLETAWWIQYVDRTDTVPRDVMGSLQSTAPARFVITARTLVDAGRDAAAIDLLTRAFLLTQMQLEAFSDERIEQLSALSQRQMTDLGARGIVGLFAQEESAAYYDRLRDILRLYPSRERDALDAGDPALVARYRDAQAALLESIRHSGGLEGAEFIVMESFQTEAPRGGVGYRVTGVEGRETILTPLPGAPHPDTLSETPSFFVTSDALLQDLANQEAFLSRLAREPAIRAEFGSTAIDMNDRSHRIRVFRTLYDVFARHGSGGRPLAALLDLMEQYLRAYTRHTVYNVRDFGENYLDAELPENLAGQLVRDCGVYALNVAYEVYQVARNTTPRLNLDLRLYATFDHAMLVIVDASAHEHYLVNNDAIDGPLPGDSDDAVYASVAKAYGDIAGYTYYVSPVTSVDLGSISQSDSRFRRRAWRRYRAGTRFGPTPLPPSAVPGDAPSEAERSEAASSRYYDLRDDFHVRTRRLESALDRLTSALQGLPSDDARRALLARRLPTVQDDARFLVTYFEQFGVGPLLSGSASGTSPGRAHVVVSPSRRTRSLATVGYLYGTAATGAHPLVRLAMALTYYRALGGSLSADQHRVLDLVRDVNGFAQTFRPFARNPGPVF